MTSIKRISQLNLRFSFESNPRPIKWKIALNTKSILSLSPLTSNQHPASLLLLLAFVAQRLLQLKVLQFRANLPLEIFAALFTWMCAIYGLVVVALLCSCTNLVFSFSWRNQILHPLTSTNWMRKSYCILRVTKPFWFSSRESIPKACTYHNVRLFSRFLIFNFVHVLDPIKM